MVSSYAMFVKEHIHQFKHLPAKQRMKAVAELYKKNKSGVSEPVKKGKGRPKKGGVLTAAGLDEKGGSILGDIVPFGHMLGLGLEDKKGGAMTAGKLVRKKKGGSILGDIVPFGNMLGLGLEDKKGGVMTAAGLHKKRGRPKKGGAMTAAGLDEKGGSILGDMIPFGNMLGLGLQHKKRGRKAKGGAMTAGALPMAHSVGPLHAGSFSDYFIKGLTAPFQVASKINPALGFGVPEVSSALGLPSLF